MRYVRRARKVISVLFNHACVLFLSDYVQLTSMIVMYGMADNCYTHQPFCITEPAHEQALARAGSPQRQPLCAALHFRGCIHRSVTTACWRLIGSCPELCGVFLDVSSHLCIPSSGYDAVIEQQAYNNPPVILRWPARASAGLVALPEKRTIDLNHRCATQAQLVDARYCCGILPTATDACSTGGHAGRCQRNGRDKGGARWHGGDAPWRGSLAGGAIVLHCWTTWRATDQAIAPWLWDRKRGATRLHHRQLHGQQPRKG